ncbi:PREDICTED: probable aquaporin NIP-type [Lupinus angustifolius]|uniref:probable aquaporin NIP-type n=1 Tax=Lupinus angustifolius TaxID=3871 RepID=UPI00092F326B|nr:PREDICTED: probable aquaporin NIP-type [Lupinus angustifolius]
MSTDEITKMEEGGSRESGFCGSPEVVQIIQKVIAEVIGTYFLVFAGCSVVVLNKLEGSKGTITFPGICVVWGLTVMILVYALGHISGAHFNPAVTVSFAIYRHFPLKQVPLYLIAQVLGSILASGTLYLLYDDLDENSYFGTVPVGAHLKSFILEILTSFLLMFVVSAVSTDNRAIGELAGIAVGMTVLIDVFIAGPVSGASMNPARSLGPAVVMHIFDGFWLYIVGPFLGAILGASAYNLIRFTEKPLREIGASSTILKSMSRVNTFRR